MRVLLAVSIDAVGGARLPQLFSNAGCEVAVVGPRGLAITSSRHVKQHIVTDRPPTAVRFGLEAEAVSNSSRYALAVICDEPLLRMFTERAACAELARIAPVVADADRISRILSKVRFSQDAHKAGIAVPPFRVLESAEQKPRQTWRGVTTVAKAEQSLSGSGVRVIQSEQELQEANAMFKERPMLFQQYSGERVGATAVLFSHGKPQCWYSYLLRRNWPTPLASASALEPFSHAAIRPMLDKIGGMTQFHGLCGIDWVLDEKDGTPLVLEMNPRPTPGMHITSFAGARFSAALKGWLNGDTSAPEPAPTAGVDGLYRLFPQNLYRSIDSREFGEFALTWADAPFSDPRLLLSQVRRVATHYLPQSVRGFLKSRAAA